jgi:hypothetical protein
VVQRGRQRTQLQLTIPPLQLPLAVISVQVVTLGIQVLVIKIVPPQQITAIPFLPQIDEQKPTQQNKFQ